MDCENKPFRCGRKQLEETMLTTVAEIKTATTCVEVLSGAWPQPVEYIWTDPRPVVTMLFRPPGYETKGRYSDAGPSRSLDRIGQIFFVPPNAELYGWGTGGEIRAVRCLFAPDFYARTLEGGDALTAAQLRRCLDIRETLLPSLLARLHEEALAPGFLSGALAEALGCAMLIEIARHALCRPQDVRPQKNGLSRRQLRTVEDYVESLDVGAPSVSALAALCGLSERHFCRLFHEETGGSVGRYLRDVQIRRAERLLLDTDLSLKEIAFRLGFANQANFSAAFRSRTQRPPGAFRKAYSHYTD
jgi:AraC family transcriptional regulator